MGRKSLLNLSGAMSWASSASRRMLAVAPRAERTSARTARAGSAWYGRRRITSLLSVQARSMITGAVWELLLAVVVLAGGLALVVGAVVLAVRSGCAPAPWRGRRGRRY